MLAQVIETLMDVIAIVTGQPRGPVRQPYERI
jgi:hypothetical protein